jgi:hypothetical protein
MYGHDLGWEPTPGTTAHDPDDVENCVAELRDALAAHGITLPSIGVELPAFAATPRLPLVALGNCNAETARRLSAVLRTAWRVEGQS